MPQIFISYRRGDTSSEAGRLYERLSKRFGAMNVFFDHAAIPPGSDFVNEIQTKARRCDVLIALIGRRWLGSDDPAGCRLDDPDDFVRQEIAIALERDIPIIPVRVQGAAMPQADQLPPALALLARRQALELSDTRWSYDVERLIAAIEEAAPRARPALPRLLASLPAPWRLALVLLVITVGALSARFNPGSMIEALFRERDEQPISSSPALTATPATACYVEGAVVVHNHSSEPATIAADTIISINAQEFRFVDDVTVPGSVGGEHITTPGAAEARLRAIAPVAPDAIKMIGTVEMPGSSARLLVQPRQPFSCGAE
jgi:hypothetical protein